MKTHLIAAAVLSLGFMASGAFAQNNSNNYCPDDQRDRANYADCVNVGPNGSDIGTAAFRATVINPEGPMRVGDYVDETPEQSNQRSSK